MLKINKFVLGLFLLFPILVNSEPTSQNQQSDNGVHSYYYNNEKLKNALERYAKKSGLEIFIAPDARQIMNKEVNGRFSIENNVNLIDALSKQYGFNWFVYSGTLYINGLKTISQSVDVSQDDMLTLKKNLLDLGLLDTKFGYSEMPSENKVLITGPFSYVNMVVQQIHHLNLSPITQKFAVIKLNYAKSSDTSFIFNEQEYVIPGVATLLQNILNTNGKIEAGVESAIIQNSQNTNKIKTNTAMMTDSAIVQSDDRLNALIIRDKPGNIRIYRELIAALDVPTALIQIEVMILFLDQSKLSQAGVSWWGAMGNNGLSGGFGASNLTQVNNKLNMYYGAVNPGQSLVSNIQNFIVGLDFLEANNFAKVASKPSLVTTDNIPAIMNINETLWMFNANTTTTSSNANNSTQMNAMQIQAINALQITPHVIKKAKNNRDIKLSILLQDGSLNDKFIINEDIQKTTQSSITSQAVIAEGQSLLLAGYTRSIMEKAEKGVPLLKDIPGLGWFFKTSSERQKQVSTVYVVTPKIIWIDGINNDNHKIDYSATLRPENKMKESQIIINTYPEPKIKIANNNGV